MLDMMTGLYILLFTYGFSIAYHVMGSTKFYMLRKFQLRKALLGIYQELGYFLFLLLLFMIPIFVDLSNIGINLQLDRIIIIVLVFPLAASIKKCYEMAIEVKNIDVSTLDDVMDGEEDLLSTIKDNKEFNLNVTLKGDIDYGKKDQRSTGTKEKKPKA